jgi:FdrA protein
MAALCFEIRPGSYYDSVILMQLQRALAELPGVLDAGVVMGTPANHELLLASGLYPSEAATARPDDLLIVIQAEDEEAGQRALAQVDRQLQRRRTTIQNAFQPRSLDSALKQMPQATWVLVSVPGRYAAGVAREALAQGRHLFLYSDNVALEDEIALKQEAAEKGLLVMGPDCGTAIIQGIGLGFANRVRRGAIGLVGASGTGLQAITSRIHNLGGGVSQAIGTGGRDLRAAVGGLTAGAAIDLLGRDPETRVIVLVSKPPAAEVATRLLATAMTTGKPTVIYFQGYAPPGRRINNLHFARNLTEAARMAVDLSREEIALQDDPAAKKRQGPYVRGLFSGGTLAYEAVLGLQAVLHPLYTNVPVRPEQRLPDANQRQGPVHRNGHTILDLGADEFTQGRLHPMIDPDLRLRRMKQEALAADVGLILLDVVLGEGAHPDPAGALASTIQQVTREENIAVVALVVGTDDDPQNRPGQIDQLHAAGAMVFTDTGDMVAYIARHWATAATATVSPPVSLAALQAPFAAVNIGLATFADSLAAQGAEVVSLDWRPPAGGDEKLMALLAKMKN